MLFRVTAAKPRSRGYGGAIEGEAAAGQGAGTERHEIGAAPGFGEAFPIAREHLEIGEQVVRPEDGLRAPHVRVAGNHGIGILLGEIDQRAHYTAQQGAHAIAFLAQPEARIERHLFVAAAAGVDLVGHLAGPFLQFADDQRVHVFIGGAFVERGEQRLGADRVERRDDFFPLRGAQNADTLQGSGECLRAANIRVDQPAVEIERSAEALENFARSGFKTAAPELHTEISSPPGTASASCVRLFIECL